MEQMLPVPGFPGYSVTADGKVWSDRAGRWLTPSPYSGGYPGVSLYKDKKAYARTVHTLVALAFLGPRPSGMEVRHLNGIQSDNRLENLAYGTHAENMQDKVRHGTHHLANKTHCPKGHPYSGDNLIVESSGKRKCRTCRMEYRRSPEYLARQREYGKQRRAKNAKPRKPRKLKTHCHQGHPYDDQNTRIKPNGGRVCRTCHRNREREARRTA